MLIGGPACGLVQRGGGRGEGLSRSRLTCRTWSAVQSRLNLEGNGAAASTAL